MMHTRATLATATAVAAMLFIPPAHADAPTNDDFDSPDIVGTVPFSGPSSTVEATRDDDDPGCGSGGSVWFAFTAPSDSWFEARMSGSDYDTYLGAFRGARGSLEEIGCNDDYYGLDSAIQFEAALGETYYFLVSGYSGQTGNSTFVLQETAPPPPRLTSVTVSVASGSVDRRGNVTVRGTVTCDVQGWASIYVNGAQSNRRFTAAGGGYSGTSCGTTPTSWSTTFGSYTGVTFLPGRMTADVYAGAYGEQGGFAWTELSEKLRLTRSR